MDKKKTKKPPIVLTTETIRSLDDAPDKLREVRGGLGCLSCGNSCLSNERN